MRRTHLALLCSGLAMASPLAAQQRTPPRRTPPPTTRPDTTRRPAARPDTTKRPTPARTPPRTPPPRGTAAVRRPAPPPNERTFAAAGGAAQAGLDFGVGPAIGFVGRYRRGTWPVALRVDGLFSLFSQTATVGGTALSEKATLNHFGVGGGIEYPLGQPRNQAPYLVGTAGVYRFAGSGPAGDAGDIPDGVFTGTTDVAVGIGGGFRFLRRFFVEARFVSVGDFSIIPITVGYNFQE